MIEHEPLSQQIKEAKKEGRLDDLEIGEASEWIGKALESENSGRQILQVKEWLMRTDTKWRSRKSSFQAEDVMKQLGWSGLAFLGIVEAALHEMCGEGHVVMLDEGTSAVYTYTFMNER